MMQALKCLKGYMTGLASNQKRDPTDEENIEGKIVIITGANSGETEEKSSA